MQSQVIGIVKVGQFISQFNKVRLPYNSNSISQLLAEKLLGEFPAIQKQIDVIKEERDRMLKELSEIAFITPYPSDSNFILFQVQKDSAQFFQALVEKGILIRNLAEHPSLQKCLRVTVGTKEENEKFLQQVRSLES